jgi:Fic family protein
VLVDKPTLKPPVSAQEAPVAETPLIFADTTERRDRLARAVTRGELARLARGIYTSDVHNTPETVVRRHIWEILSHEIPSAVITDLSVEDGGTGLQGFVYVAASRPRPLRLPGITILPRAGSGPVDGDSQLPGGIWIAGDARALLDNLVPSRLNQFGQRRTGGVSWVERRLDKLCAERGPAGLNRLRDQARTIAGLVDRELQFTKLDALIGAALNTRSAQIAVTPELRARATGTPYDQSRLTVFTRLAGALADVAPAPLPDLPTDVARRTLLPFYEAYFSNYIEGTEFTLDEAAAIVFDQEIPAGRSADAHDIFGTYQLTSSAEQMRTAPSTPVELLDLLSDRHAILMGGRPDVHPGRFKTRANRAGSTEFVAPDLVEGTLRAGFEASAGLLDPFARAVFLMFLISEVHPFADGNGRTARIFMNAELVSAGQVRLVVPTVYRLNYLSALKAATHTEGDQALIAALRFAQRWTARIDWGSRGTAEADLTRTNALRDAREAEEAGLRLTMP